VQYSCSLPYPILLQHAFCQLSTPSHTNSTHISIIMLRIAASRALRPVASRAAIAVRATSTAPGPNAPKAGDDVVIVSRTEESLEWTLSSPPPVHQFEEPPSESTTVYNSVDTWVALRTQHSVLSSPLGDAVFRLHTRVLHIAIKRCLCVRARIGTRRCSRQHLYCSGTCAMHARCKLRLTPLC
jgi:hypothetical protein